MVNPFLFPVSLSPPGRGKGEARLCLLLFEPLLLIFSVLILGDVDEKVNLIVMPTLFCKYW